MKLSERFLFNMADAYVLQCSGFPMERIAELDNVNLQIEESLFMNVCSLPPSVILERDDYSKLITPGAKLIELKAEIDLQFDDVSSDARQCLWSFASQYLWNKCNRVLSDINHEKRFRDPELGEFFRLWEEAKKQGLWNQPLLDDE